jgi:predicted small integral membrane protein
MLSTIAEIIRDLLIFVGVIAALLIALVVAVSKMPNANPLKGILTIGSQLHWRQELSPSR